MHKFESLSVKNIKSIQHSLDCPDGPVVKTSSSKAGGVGLIPGRGDKILHTSWPKNQNIKQKQYCNKFNKDFKNGPHQKKKKRKNLKKQKDYTAFLICTSVERSQSFSLITLEL